MSEISNLIICNPYDEPSKHWSYNRTKRKFDLIKGRRSAGFLVATSDSKTFDDPGEFRELALVNKIREKVKKWREKNYPGITGVTKQLLTFWRDHSKREDKLFFCQIEAIETLIWLTESAESEKQGIKIPSDGGLFQRYCCKMATGTGKTLVMAMLIAWQVINKITYPKDTRFSKNILVLAPGLTVKSRLSVLFPTSTDNFYNKFKLVPESLFNRLFKGKFVIHNWHTLMPEEDVPRSVVKLGKESNEIFSKRILQHDYKNIIVINDEAHHAYRANNDQIKNISKTDFERDKRWIEGLDKIHNSRKIIHCFDFSATPFIPSGKNVSEETLFEWIVSDFSLNDAIESGLTKTPRISIRDDSNEFREFHPRFYHLYKDDHVKSDLNRDAKKHEKLPELIHNAYSLLGRDWIETKKLWDKNNSKIPPVMITVCNKTNTAARIMYSFENNKFDLKELSIPEYLLHIDSTTMDNTKNSESTKSDEVENLRKKADTVGKLGMPGEQIRNIVAVSMLSEGWDAQNVTHIMGLRAFSSQLLCEQVIGRGLRRTSYDVKSDGLFSSEYVNVFGIPFTFLPHEGGDGTPPPPTTPTTRIEPDPKKSEHEISWPNIDRIHKEFTPKLKVDWDKIKPLRLNSTGISTRTDMAPIHEGKAHEDKVSEIDSRKQEPIRLQRTIFVTVKDIYDTMKYDWYGNKEFLLLQIVKIVEDFIKSDKIIVTGATNDDLRTRLTIRMKIEIVVNHILNTIENDNVEKKQIHLNPNKPTKSTKDMIPWDTKKPAEHTTKSHINLAVYDRRSSWEMGTGQKLERNENVVSWVKNDHIGFVIKYLYNGIMHEYYPDFLIKLNNGITLVLEIKGRDNDQNIEKRRRLKEWVDAVNDDGSYGTWLSDVAFDPSKVEEIITNRSKSTVSANGYAKCPKCYKKAKDRQNIEKEFGFRNVNGITRPQSWCRDCRKNL